MTLARRIPPFTAEEIAAIADLVAARVVACLAEQEAKRRDAEAAAEAEMIAALEKERSTPQLVRDVMRAASEVTQIDIEVLKGPRRSRSLAWPRQVAMYACVMLASNASLPQIGRAFNRDHTTVLHSVRVVKERLKRYPETRALYAEIVGRVVGGAIQEAA